MSRFIAYLRAQSLRTLKLYPIVFAFTVLLTMGLSVILLQMFASNDAADSRQHIRIGIVGDITDTYLEAGLFALRNLDSSQYYLDFVTTTEEDAAAQLGRGELMAYLRIPQGFVEDMINGRDVDIAFVAGNSPSALGPLLMREIAETVSDIVVYAQKGVYGYDALADGRLGLSQRYENVNELSLVYATRIFGRDAVYRVDIIGISQGLPFKDYYLCAGFFLILLMCGTICAPLLIKTDLALPRLMHTTGFSSRWQIGGELLPFALMLCVNSVLLLTVAGTVFSAQTDTFGILPEYTSVTDYLLLAVRLLPVVLLIAAWQFLVYELTSHLISGVLLQVLLTLSLSYASGFMLPLAALPPTLQAVSAYLPTGIGFRYMSGLLTETATWEGAAVVGYALALAVLAMLVRKWKIGRTTDNG